MRTLRELLGEAEFGVRTYRRSRDQMTTLRKAHRSELKRRKMRADDREELEPEGVMASHDFRKGHSLHSEIGPRGGVRHTFLKHGNY